MNKMLVSVGAFFGMAAIILGAFGAHALKQRLAPEQLQVFETGVKYQMYHALFLLFIALVPNISAKAKNAILWVGSVGVLLFSGSLYLLSTGLGENVKKVIGPLTPIGGMLMIAGWMVLLITILKKKS